LSLQVSPLTTFLSLFRTLCVVAVLSKDTVFFIVFLCSFSHSPFLDECWRFTPPSSLVICRGPSSFKTGSRSLLGQFLLWPPFSAFHFFLSPCFFPFVLFYRNPSPCSFENFSFFRYVCTIFGFLLPLPLPGKIVGLLFCFLLPCILPEGCFPLTDPFSQMTSFLPSPVPASLSFKPFLFFSGSDFLLRTRHHGPPTLGHPVLRPPQGSFPLHPPLPLIFFACWAEYVPPL